MAVLDVIAIAIPLWSHDQELDPEQPVHIYNQIHLNAPPPKSPLHLLSISLSCTLLLWKTFVQPTATS